MRIRQGNTHRVNTILSNGVLWIALIAALTLPLTPIAAQTPPTGQARADLQAQLDALEKEASQIDQNIKETQGQAKTLQNQISILNNEIKQHEIQIKRINLAITQANADIQVKTNGITVVSSRMDNDRGLLADSINRINDYDRENLVVVLVKNQNLADFFAAFDNIKALQAEINNLIGQLRGDKKELETQKAVLEQYREDQLALRSAAEVERQAIVANQKEKDRLLALTKGKEQIFQQLLAKKQQDITALKNQLYYIESAGISATDALKYADLAARRAGIRTAFLLALLEVETGRQFENGQFTVGSNLGTGNWKRDMYDCYVNLGRTSAAEAQKAAFFQITSSLGLNPDTMPVSKKPSYGCGGAMGPAQFIPTTWLLFDDRVADLTGHRPPSPWSVEDAFTASALFLADAGAKSQTDAGELAAARTYISGRPSCPPSGASRVACQAYSSRVLSLSRDIDRVI